MTGEASGGVDALSTAALTVLVTGASGFVGRHVTPALLRAGHRVRAMTRHPDDYEGAGEPVFGDVHDPASLREALEGAEVALYLVHSLGEDDFERLDAEAAEAFGRAAAEAGISQIVYLGGLGREGEELSAHLRSRREVERLLGGAGVPVTTLRAAVIIGDGGISWEITRQLVHNLPAMVVPHWTTTRSQPVGLDDVVRYLVGLTGRAEAYGRAFEIGGSDILTYLEMLQQAAEEMTGHRIPIVPVPVLTPRLSSRWIGLVTDVDVATARTLIDSMSTEVVQTEWSIRDLVPGEPMSYRQAVRLALGARL